MTKDEMIDWFKSAPKGSRHQRMLWTAREIARLTGVTEGGAYQTLLSALIEGERLPAAQSPGFQWPRMNSLSDGNYYLPATDETIPADMAAPSPDDRFHHCVDSAIFPLGFDRGAPVWGAARTRCFFAPMNSS
jgi:hypothetical protein